jgi:hypothetical protein
MSELFQKSCQNLACHFLWHARREIRQLRQIRNLGAHDAEDEVTEADVRIIVDFLEAILEYLFDLGRTISGKPSPGRNGLNPGRVSPPTQTRQEVAIRTPP